MKKLYNVHLHETICGDVEIEAKTEAEAREQALQSANVDWWSETTETKVTGAIEINEDGDAIDS